MVYFTIFGPSDSFCDDIVKSSSLVDDRSNVDNKCKSASGMEARMLRRAYNMTYWARIDWDVDLRKGGTVASVLIIDVLGYFG